MKVILSFIVLSVFVCINMWGFAQDVDSADYKSGINLLQNSNCILEFGPARLRYRQCYKGEVMTGVDALVNGELKYIYCAQINIKCTEKQNKDNYDDQNQ